MKKIIATLLGAMSLNAHALIGAPTSIDVLKWRVSNDAQLQGAYYGYFSAITNMTEAHAEACIPEGVELVEASDVYVLYMKENQKFSDGPAAATIQIALSEKWPCEKKGDS